MTGFSLLLPVGRRRRRLRRGQRLPEQRPHGRRALRPRPATSTRTRSPTAGDLERRGEPEVRPQQRGRGRRDPGAAATGGPSRGWANCGPTRPTPSQWRPWGNLRASASADGGGLPPDPPRRRDAPTQQPAGTTARPTPTRGWPRRGARPCSTSARLGLHVPPPVPDGRTGTPRRRRAPARGELQLPPAHGGRHQPSVRARHRLRGRRRRRVRVHRTRIPAHRAARRSGGSTTTAAGRPGARCSGCEEPTRDRGAPSSS